MAKIKVTGSAMVLTSDVKLEDIKKLEKFSPESLKIIDENENEVFKIGTGLNGFNKYGATFNEANADGKAVATVLLPEGIENKAKYVKDNYGYALLKLNTLEEFIAEALTELSADFEKIDANITVE